MAINIKNMGSCKIQSLTPKCRYQLGGIKEIWVLNKETFRGYAYSGALEECKVFGIMRSNKFLEVAVSEDARYSSNKQKGVYLHSIETFVAGLSSELSASLHNASKTRWVVVFKTASGRSLTFGADAGATIQHEGKTENGEGFTLTISANSTLPLFELTEETMNIETLVSLGGVCVEGNYSHKVLARVSKSGEPLDVDCIPTRISGKRQGAYLARGEEVEREDGDKLKFKDGAGAYNNLLKGYYNRVFKITASSTDALNHTVLIPHGVLKDNVNYLVVADYYCTSKQTPQNVTLTDFGNNQISKSYTFTGNPTRVALFTPATIRGTSSFSVVGYSGERWKTKNIGSEYRNIMLLEWADSWDGVIPPYFPHVDDVIEGIVDTHEIIAYFAPGEAVEGFATKEEGCKN